MLPFNFLEEVIHGDKFRDVADVVIDREPTDQQAEFILGRNCVIFCKTDFIQMLFEILKFAGEDRRYVIITHNSDRSIDQNLYNIKPNCIEKWYALNVAIRVHDLIPIPSGMERPLGCGYSSNPVILSEQMNQPREIKNLVYMNHNANNNHCERDELTGYFSDRTWVTKRELGVSFSEYIKNIYAHKFVISPPGGGIDCHRTWESLYMGSIPIVKRSVLTEAFAELPILIVEDWTTLTEKLLNIIYNDFSAREFCYDKLKFSYWKSRIEIDKGLLNEYS